MDFPPQLIVLISNRYTLDRSRLKFLVQETINSLLAIPSEFRILLPKSYNFPLEARNSNGTTIERLEIDLNDNYRSLVQLPIFRSPLDWVIFLNPGDLVFPTGFDHLKKLPLTDGVIGRTLVSDSSESQSVTYEKLPDSLSRESLLTIQDSKLTGSSIRYEQLRNFTESKNYDLLTFLRTEVPSIIRWEKYPLLFCRSDARISKFYRYPDTRNDPDYLWESR